MLRPALTLILFLAAPLFAATDYFTVVSGPASPRVAIQVLRKGENLDVFVEVPASDDSPGRVELGIAAAQKIILSDKDVVLRSKDGGTRQYTLLASKLIQKPADWEKLRIGIAVSWPGGPFGQDRQRERYLHSGGATHGGLSPEPTDWLPFNLIEHELEVTARKNRIVIPFTQHVAGKATLVLEDAKGNRLRNLIAGIPFEKGEQRVEWDGLDEQGRVVLPGSYNWRSIHHPGIKPDYLFSFCNDGAPPWRTGSGTDMWGPDHSHLLAAASAGDWTFFGGSCAESGYAIVAVDASGTKRMQYNPVMGTGIERVELAAMDKYLYAAHDGFAWGQHIDKTKPDWKATRRITLTRFDIKSGQIAEYKKGGKFVVVSTAEFGPASANKEWKTMSLQGLAAKDGKVYVSDVTANVIHVIDASSGEKSGELKVPAPGALCFAGAALLAITGGKIVNVALDTAALRPLFDAPHARGLAASAEGIVYYSDSETHTIKVRPMAGVDTQRNMEIGKPGGPYAGPYIPERMINPRALALAANGWLWVTEDRGSPKRVSAWEISSGKIVKEKFGPTAYGASGAGLDTKDQTRWIGQGALWKLDFATKTSQCLSLLKKEDGRHGSGAFHYSFVQQDGRTFVVGMGYMTSISELKADGTIKDLVMIGSTHRYCFGHDWHPPQVFIDAFNKAYPKLIGKHADKGPGYLWLDRNGDGEPQADEFEFSTGAENFAGAYWGHDQRELTLRIPARVNGKVVLVTLKADGYIAGGAPKYPPLNAAITASVPIALEGNEIETTIDRFGNVICNSDPNMKSFAPDGRLRWTYPNRWSNVHGSHNAPLPEPGMMQGALFFLGMAPLDDKSDVFVMNGNHGRFFVISSDGLYMDEMFKDVRMGGTLDAHMIGGECFGGTFGKSEKDGAYYLQSGHTDYRIFRMSGFENVKRGEGKVDVSPDQAAAAERNLAGKVARTILRKEARAQKFEKEPVIDGKENDWGKADAVAWDKSGQFKVTVRTGYDDKNLYLFYNVADNSPWVNNGKEWTMLFKTGDSVDIQIATDPAANPGRSQPVAGDLRVIFAPIEGKNIAVLYRHRGAKENLVTFTSPWRSETVDAVKKLENARIAVIKDNGKYTLEAAIPLSDLGLAAPSGKTFKADFGVIYGDPDGTINMLRSYWSNQNTGLVNDVPGEIMLDPKMWGTLQF